MSGRAHVLGMAIDRLSFDQTVDRCIELIEEGGPATHLSVNAAKIVAAHRDARLREIAERRTIVGADGQSVVWASRLLGDALPERVAGIDLMHGLLSAAEARGYGVFILGARETVLQHALARLIVQHPQLRICGSHHGYFPENESSRVAALVRAAAPDILFVAMSSPRKEYWIDEWAEASQVPLVIGVGGAIDVLSGLTRRAPIWLQRAGLEWLFRLAQEPRRLFHRYARTNTAFLFLLLRELLRGSRFREVT